MDEAKCFFKHLSHFKYTCRACKNTCFLKRNIQQVTLNYFFFATPNSTHYTFQTGKWCGCGATKFKNLQFYFLIKSNFYGRCIFNCYASLERFKKIVFVDH